MTTLQEQLCIQPNTDSEEELSRISEILLNKVSLFIFKKEFKLTDIEILYYEKDVHEDPWLHNDYHQLNDMTWYFHGRGPKMYCTDLTIGDIDKNIYASILIRKAESIDGEVSLEGPTGFTNYVREKFGYPDLISLREGIELGATKPINPKFYVELKNEDRNDRVYTLPRGRAITKQGQDWNEPNKLKYLFRFYRYTTKMSDSDQNKFLYALRYFSDNESNEIRKYLKVTDNVFKKHRDAFLIGYNKELSEINEIIDLKSQTEKPVSSLGYGQSTTTLLLVNGFKT